MVTVKPSKRQYCIACCSSTVTEAYELSFGDPEVTSISVKTLCRDCLVKLQEDAKNHLNRRN